MLGVDEGGDPAGRLRVGHGVQGNRGLTAAFRSVDLHHPTTGQPADAERDVERDRAGGDDSDRDAHLVAEAHHGTLAKALVDLCESHLEGFFAVRSSHVLLQWSTSSPVRGGPCCGPIDGDVRSGL